MVTYTAIESGFARVCSSSDLIDLRWRKRGLVADFKDPLDDESLWRVIFADVDFVRILDELYLSTEDEPGSKDGLIPENFAYLVEGSQFYRSQSDLLPDLLPASRHYRFVTGWTCVDVLSKGSPKFENPRKIDR